MSLLKLVKLITPILSRRLSIRKCHSVFGIKDLIHQERPDNFTVCPVPMDQFDIAVDIIKKYYLNEHILVRARNMNLSNDRAVDEYIHSLLKQGNSLFVKGDKDSVAGVCISYASSPIDAKNLRNYAFYRQDPNTKDFLYFTAKLQETPNLWQVFSQQKVFEIKMLTVLPAYRRQGLAMLLVEKSKEEAHDQGYSVIRMDCINPYDYKIAEKCNLQCILKFPLHKLRGTNAPYIKRSSEHNRYVRVYVDARIHPDTYIDRAAIKKKTSDLESLVE